MRSAALIFCVHLLGVAGCSSGAPSTRAPGSSSSVGDVPGRVVQASGSRGQVWLPDTATRPTPLFAFRNESPNLAVLISEVTAPNDRAAAEVLEGMKDASKKFEPLTETTRGSARGFTCRGETNGLAVRIIGLQEGRAATSVAVAFEPNAEKLADKVMNSVELEGAAVLDPLAIHGIRIGRLEGMQVWPVMSQPILLKEP